MTHHIVLPHIYPGIINADNQAMSEPVMIYNQVVRPSSPTRRHVKYMYNKEMPRS
jgi:hypothetical protein